MTFFVPHLFYRGQTENKTRTNLVEQSKKKRDHLAKRGNYVAQCDIYTTRLLGLRAMLERVWHLASTWYQTCANGALVLLILVSMVIQMFYKGVRGRE